MSEHGTPETGDGGTVLATILTFDAPEAVTRCLERLEDQDRRPDEVLVVDNAGDRPAAPAVEGRTWAFPVRLVRTTANLGPAGGHALALERFLASPHDWVWILDDDIRADPGALTALLDVGRRHHPALVEPRIRDDATGEEVRRHGWWGVVLPRAVVADVGLPDARLFWWTEDTEYLQWRIPNAGYPAVRTDEVVAAISRRRSSAAKPGWKYYYEARNQVHHRLRVQRPPDPDDVPRHLTRRVRVWRAGRSVTKLAVRSVVRERDGRAGKLWMVVRGTGDGLRGRLGITVVPDRSHRPDA